MAEEPPPAPPTESLMKRCKLIWRLLLISNFGLGAYLFVMAKMKNSTEIHSRTAQKLQKIKPTVEVPPEPITRSMESTHEEEIDIESLYEPAVTMPIRVHDPIPEEQQREIFKRILEEKRRVKPKDHAEKKQIDEEKAILKQFLRAESIPKF